MPQRGSSARRLVHVLVGAGLLWMAAPARAELVKESHPIFGALLRITVEATDHETGQNRIRDAVAVAHRLESQLDLSDPESDLMRLHANAGLRPVPMPLDVYRLLALSQLMTHSTGGAFDVTVGPLLKRRQAAAGERAPRLAVEEALSLVGADKIVLHAPDRVELVDSGMSIDFGAIAKGYILERMAAQLRADGIAKALLEFEDATVLALGPPQNEPPFRVWIARGKSMAGSAFLRDRSLSTVRTRRRIEEGPRPLVVDPRSGRFVESERQATVVALDAAIAEAWSTALVVDPDGVIGLLEEPRDIEALVFDEHGEHQSPRFVAFAQFRPGFRMAGPPEPDGVAGPPDSAEPAGSR